MTDSLRPSDFEGREEGLRGVAEELTFDVAGLRLAARAHGPTDGLPVLALHGWLDNAASFDALAPLLPEARLVALDLPGHGLSDHRSPDGRYHFIDWLGDVVAALDSLGWQQSVWMGHSMGAGIATLLAGALPQRVQRLVLIEGMGPQSSAPDDMPDRVARHIDEQQRRWAKPSTPTVYADVESVAQTLFHALDSLSLEGARMLAARGVRPIDGGGVTWRTDSRLRGTSPLRLTEDHVQAFMRRITAPVLFLQAAAGWPFDPTLLASRCAWLRDLEHRSVPGGHHCHLDEAAAVAPYIRSFLGLPDA